MADIYIRGKDGRPWLIGKTADPELPGRVTALEERMEVIETAPGGVPLSDAVDSASSTTAATSRAVKTAYDKAVAAAAGLRIPLTENKDIYVNCVTGSDDLDNGRGESAEKPFKTAQAAINYVCGRYFIGTHQAKVRLSEGRFDEDILLPPTDAAFGGVEIVGAGKELTTISGCVYAGCPTFFSISDLSVDYGGRNTPGLSVYRGISAQCGATVFLNNVAVSAQERVSALVIALYGGVITMRGACAISGQCQEALCATYGEIVVGGTINVDVSAGTFARASHCGVIQCWVSAAFSGNCTGKRYAVDGNALIATGGRGPDFLPGDTEGSVENGGIYA